ncbi:phospholipase carboxylesterase family protein (macronuclear) [Tetrahymena thermophila SB210]|uniref:Phospholipase carboxylesterase family protein n=1 Tax=Tetrahymena thermophila (strain SB210) TaxID=312017 RepID=I7MIJ4_TETTS|nr:phospholipase carboxylesterase family protein [Tetrahymena thermophila SB210]EAS04490.2 phospholipase carboxylesterase family protein [Tetrahymena thermophila SB210]|eukprot:XP_001024735.2 phospholipase carboxylesterase family protein [Tetrahymena thermophila SB210]
MDNSFQDYKISINEKGEVVILPFDGKYDYVLVFIHGLNCFPVSFLKTFLSEPLKSATKNFKIVIPIAPVRKVTSRNIEAISWFDIKTYERSFERPFDEAFSSQEVQESFQQLKLVIEQEAKLLNGDYKKIFISGFSQGCGMSIYTAYGLEHDVGGVVGLAGYFFEITKYDKQRNIPTLILHGQKDNLRIWEEVKKSYEKFQGSDKVILVQEMAHEVESLEARKLFAEFLIKQTKL